VTFAASPSATTCGSKVAGGAKNTVIATEPELRRIRSPTAA
jgi:hypothetical protein